MSEEQVRVPIPLCTSFCSKTFDEGIRRVQPVHNVRFGGRSEAPPSIGCTTQEMHLRFSLHNSNVGRPPIRL